MVIVCRGWRFAVHSFMLLVTCPNLMRLLPYAPVSIYCSTISTYGMQANAHISSTSVALSSSTTSTRAPSALPFAIGTSAAPISTGPSRSHTPPTQVPRIPRSATNLSSSPSPTELCSAFTWHLSLERSVTWRWSRSRRTSSGNS